MLKIHSFLREMKSTGTPAGIMILKRRDKIAAPIVYITVAAMLVFNFSYFSSFSKYASSMHAKAETIINMLDEDEVEETHTSEITTTDNNQYTFSSLNLNQDIFITERLEKSAEFQFLADLKASNEMYPYSMDEIINANDMLYEMAEAVSVKTEKIIEQTDVDKKAEKVNTKKETKEDLELLALNASGLTGIKNKSMMIELSHEEVDVLQRIVEAEATGEDIYGKILVANVVLNRVLSNDFPDTVKEVVFQKSGGSYQFSPTKDGRYWSVSVTDSTVEAVERALSGEDYSQGALYFFARELTSNRKAEWFDNALNRLFQYGCHEFYKEK